MSGIKLVPLASSVLRPEAWAFFEDIGYDPDSKNPGNEIVSDLDAIAEFAGRACYESYTKPNPATASNQAYLKNTVSELQHESILEHSTATFYIAGVSRNLLLELERHRHLSFSVISTRYVSQDKMGVVLHPNTPASFASELHEHDIHGRAIAEQLYLQCREEGLGVKESREVARQILGGNTETKFVVTGNLRAWRYVINLRAHPKADAEIQQLAGALLFELKKIAPNSFQDM